MTTSVSARTVLAPRMLAMSGSEANRHFESIEPKPLVHKSRHRSRTPAADRSSSSRRSSNPSASNRRNERRDDRHGRHDRHRAGWSGLRRGGSWRSRHITRSLPTSGRRRCCGADRASRARCGRFLQADRAQNDPHCSQPEFATPCHLSVDADDVGLVRTRAASVASNTDNEMMSNGLCHLIPQWQSRADPP